MEYFRIIKMKTTEDHLQKSLALNNLDAISMEIFNLDVPSKELSNIGGIWENSLCLVTKSKAEFALLY